MSPMPLGHCSHGIQALVMSVPLYQCTPSLGVPSQPHAPVQDHRKAGTCSVLYLLLVL